MLISIHGGGLTLDEAGVFLKYGLAQYWRGKSICKAEEELGIRQHGRTDV